MRPYGDSLDDIALTLADEVAEHQVCRARHKALVEEVLKITGQ